MWNQLFTSANREVVVGPNTEIQKKKKKGLEPHQDCKLKIVTVGL